ncbi:hypothetical protein N8460_06375 [Oceanospirillaceae bacterium]|nr:hypothetical protein [Oceanospirillaceae bacterium]
MPKAVNQAIIGIWITLGLSVAAAIVNQRTGALTNGEFFWCIFMYAVLCIFPYKLYKGSNTARWIYSILTGVTVAYMLLSIGDDMPQVDWLLLAITVPIKLFIIISLFDRESSRWFLWGSN